MDEIIPSSTQSRNGSKVLHAIAKTILHLINRYIFNARTSKCGIATRLYSEERKTTSIYFNKKQIKLTR
jgi:hypothetical protein